MQHNDLNNKVIDALNDKAKTHVKRHVVINNVFEKLEQKRHHHFNRWGFAGVALVAAVTGFAILPNNVLTEPVPSNTNFAVTTTKLTPQLADDLEMLLVLGEDATHGS